MTKSIFLLSNTSDALNAFSQAIKKYTGIFSTKIVFTQCKNANELSGLVEMGRKADLIFIQKEMEKAEITALLAAFIRYTSSLPVLISTGLQKDLEGKLFPPDRIVHDAQMTKDYIFSCLRLYLEDGDREIDVRIFKEILLSVIEVVFQNTGERLTPYSISKAKSEHEVQDVSSIVAFFGEGIKGTLMISTSLELLRHFSKKLLQCEESDLTTETTIDVMTEISSQVLGVVRKALSEYGYELNGSMQISTIGEKHTMHNSSTGHYYSLPFSFMNLTFNVTFCYDTYPIKLNSKSKAIAHGAKKLDVRLVNEISEQVLKTINLNTKLKVELISISYHKSHPYQADSLHLIHGRGSEGGYILAIEASNAAAKEIVKKMMFCEDSDVNQNLVADSIGEMVNQIQGSQKKAIERFGYSFQNIVHVSFTSATDINYMLKNPGHYVRILCRLEDQHDLTICYGLDSNFVHDFLDISGYIQKL